MKNINQQIKIYNKKQSRRKNAEFFREVKKSNNKLIINACKFFHIDFDECSILDTNTVNLKCILVNWIYSLYEDKINLNINRFIKGLFETHIINNIPDRMQSSLKKRFIKNIIESQINDVVVVKFFTEDNLLQIKSIDYNISSLNIIYNPIKKEICEEFKSLSNNYTRLWAKGLLNYYRHSHIKYYNDKIKSLKYNGQAYKKLKSKVNNIAIRQITRSLVEDKFLTLDGKHRLVEYYLNNIEGMEEKTLSILESFILGEYNYV